jgi:hypothetical protein
LKRLAEIPVANKTNSLGFKSACPVELAKTNTSSHFVD